MDFVDEISKYHDHPLVEMILSTPIKRIPIFTCPCCGRICNDANPLFNFKDGPMCRICTDAALYLDDYRGRKDDDKDIAI